MLSGELPASFSLLSHPSLSPTLVASRAWSLFEQVLTPKKRGRYLVTLLDGPDLELADRFLCCISQSALKHQKLLVNNKGLWFSTWFLMTFHKPGELSLESCPSGVPDHEEVWKRWTGDIGAKWPQELRSVREKLLMANVKQGARGKILPDSDFGAGYIYVD